jgi:hypothetical protein
MSNKIYLRVSKKNITTLNRIIESYDNVGLVSTVKADDGLIMVQFTPDTAEVVRGILGELNFIEEVIGEE